MNTTSVAGIVARPKLFGVVRLLIAIAVVRLVGLVLLSAGGAIPGYYANTFSVGDALTGVTALPIAFFLGRGGARVYALAVTWAFAGLLDLLYALSIAAQADGLLASISDFLGSGIVIVPIAMVLQSVVLALLLLPSVSRYATSSRQSS